MMGVKYIIMGMLYLINAQASLDWSIAQGQMMEFSVSYNRSSNRGLYAHNTLYSFNVDGTVFTGNRISYGRRMSNLNSHVHDLALQYLKEKIVTVYYKPNDSKDGCQSCGWRYHCAGGCPALIYPVKGGDDLSSPY